MMPDKRLFFILPCDFTVSLAIGIVNLGMIFLIKESYGASPVVVGWFTALWAGAYFLGCIAFRPLSRKIDAATSTVLMGFISAAVLAAQFAAPSLIASFAAYTLYGLACALVWPRLMGWLASGLEGSALSRASGSYNLAWSVGMTLSPYLAGTLSERGLALPIYVGIALFLATGAFMLAARGIAPPPDSGDSGLQRPRAEENSTPLRYPAWVGLFAVYLLYSIFANIFPVYAKDELSMRASGIGLLLLLRSASMAAGFWIIGRLSFWQFKKAYLPLALASSLALALAFIFVRTPLGFLFGLILLGVVQSLAYSLSIFYGASGASDRDKRMSIHEAVLTAGQILGSVGGGAAYQAISWPVVFVFASALCFLCMPVQIALMRRR
jgi:predicted MFS family arabinose efflux permease